MNTQYVSVLLTFQNLSLFATLVHIFMQMDFCLTTDCDQLYFGVLCGKSMVHSTTLEIPITSFCIATSFCINHK